MKYFYDIYLVLRDVLDVFECSYFIINDTSHIVHDTEIWLQFLWLYILHMLIIQSHDHMYLAKAFIFVNHRHLPVMPGLEAFVDWRNCAGLRGCCSRWGHVGAPCGRWNKDQMAKRANFTSTLDCECMGRNTWSYWDLFSFVGCSCFFFSKNLIFQPQAIRSRYWISDIVNTLKACTTWAWPFYPFTCFLTCQVVLWDRRARNISSNKDSKGWNSIRFDLLKSTKI